jgi:hypothetical protein
MKFFVPSDNVHYGNNNKNICFHLAFGPYEDDNQIKEAVVHLQINQFIVLEVISAKSLLGEPEGNMDNYIKDGAVYRCRDCGAVIMSALVAHSVYCGKDETDGVLHECHYEIAPYCPRCERKPDFHGAPVSVSLVL